MLPEEASSLMVQPWESYEEAKECSRKIDRLLGFEIEKIEQKIQGQSLPDRQDWSHLSEQSFQTPYQEIADLVLRFHHPETLNWIDFGAAYGRVGLVLSALRPQDQFLGFEIVPERVEHARSIYKKWGVTPETIVRADITQIEFPSFDVAFLFDFGSMAQVEAVLDKIQVHAAKRPVTVIGRGRATRHLIETKHPWLSRVEKPFNTPHWSLYRSSDKSVGPYDDSGD